jgi:hypothetical protein
MVGREVCDLLTSKENLVLDIADYPYAGMDWRGCPSILLTIEYIVDERGNIIIIF